MLTVSIHNSGSILKYLKGKLQNMMKMNCLGSQLWTYYRFSDIYNILLLENFPYVIIEKNLMFMTVTYYKFINGCFIGGLLHRVPSAVEINSNISGHDSQRYKASAREDMKIVERQTAVCTCDQLARSHLVKSKMF